MPSESSTLDKAPTPAEENGDFGTVPVETSKDTQRDGTSAQIFTNTITAWIGTAASGLIGFLLVPLLLLRLGKEGYGLTNLVGTIIGLSALADLGLRGALSRQLTEHSARNDFRAYNELASSALAAFLVVGSACCAVCLSLAPQIATAFNVSPRLMPVGIGLIRWYASATLILGFVGPVFSSTIIALGKYDRLNAAATAISLIRGVGLVVAVWWLHGSFASWALVGVGCSLLSVIANALIAYNLWPTLHLSPALVTPKALKPLFHLGSSLFAIQTGIVISTQSDPIVLSTFLGTGAVALYSPAASVVTLFRPAITAVSDQLSPFATVHHIAGEKDRLQSMLVTGTRITLLLAVLVFVLTTTFAYPVTHLWLSRSLGAEYATVANVLILWAATDLGMYAIGTPWAVLLAMKRMKLIVSTTVSLAFLNVAASVYLVGFTKLGVIGVVIPTVLQRLVTWLIIAPYTARLCGLSWGLYLKRAYLQPLAVGTLLAAGSWAVASRNT